jgi:orotidine-5'-phosphate decarboxylase
MESKIIAALDCDNAIEVAKKISDFVYAFKVNYPLILKEGIGTINRLSDVGKVIADFKIADVPHISSQIAECAFEAGAKAIIAHAFVGSDTLKAVVDVAEKYGGEVYAVCELSSEGGKEFMMPVAEKLVEVAIKAKCSGIVAPATRADRISTLKSVAKKFGGDVKVISPGVGAQGGSALSAIKSGADYVIVGRSIYIGDPVKNVKKILNELNAVID